MKPRILVAYDFSSAADRALTWAGELHRAVGGGALKVVHAVSTMPAAAAMSALPLPLPSPDDLRQTEEAIRAIAQKAAPDATVEVVLSPSPSGALVEAARAWSADLIVMGTHGRGGVTRMVLGSVADHVIRHAACPVTTFRGAD